MTEIPNNPAPADEPGGERGASGLKPATENRLLGMALKQRWPLSDETKRQALDAMKLHLTHEDARVVNGAVKNLLAMEHQNQADEHKAIPDKVHHQHSGTVGIEAVRQEVINDPQYLEYVRTRINSGDGDASGVCLPCERGEVEAGEASPPTRPGTNGRHHREDQ